MPKALLAEIRKLTHLPVLFVAQTHYHLDWVDGNDAATRNVPFRNGRAWMPIENIKMLDAPVTLDKRAREQSLALSLPIRRDVGTPAQSTVDTHDFLRFTDVFRLRERRPDNRESCIEILINIPLHLQASKPKASIPFCEGVVQYGRQIGGGLKKPAAWQLASHAADPGV